MYMRVIVTEIIVSADFEIIDKNDVHECVIGVVGFKWRYAV